MDRRFTCDEQTTKQNSVQGYINLYSGPVYLYLMHYKYSTILNVCFITFMYGFGLPILFPVAILAFLILYFVEKTMLYYSYRQLPMYDEKQSELVSRISQVATLFYLAFGYWMCSRRQLLSNEYLSPIDRVTSTMQTHHVYL